MTGTQDTNEAVTADRDAGGRTPRSCRAPRVARHRGLGAVRHARAVALALLAAMAVLTVGCGGNSTQAALQDHLLSVADLPAGWSAAPENPGTVQTSAPCLSGLAANLKGLTYAAVAFVQGTAIPTLKEVLATGPQARQTWRNVAQALARCRTATITITGNKATATIQPLPLPRMASVSSAYAWAFTIAGIRIGFDLVLFETGMDTGYLAYADLGAPPVGTVQAFVTAAVAKARTGSTPPVPGTVSIASTPVRIAHTTLGTVAYRAIGSGPPLVLITGYGATMEGWDRTFVDALAQHYHVVIFDNAGVGQTQPLPGPLSIDTMANQTSALIAALGLQQPDVLGWSMGSMIAQALAVLHPAQVRRLVLCASYPGNGTALRPSQQAINALNSGNTQQVMADLFPPGQTGAQNTYLASISSYPSAQGTPAGTVTAQGHAIVAWWDGTDPAGRLAGTIAVPTLISDGTADRLDPLANSYALADLIPGARLMLYPDAGHAFLFQDQAAFVALIEAFVG